MLVEVSSVLDAGSDVCVPLAPPPISSTTFVTTFVRILRRTISPAPISIGCSFGTILLRITARTSIFSIVPRPPYHPKYGPNEYKICEVMGKIWLKKEEDWDMNCLEHEIMLAAYQIISFDKSFQHCGYRWN
jgi:hypothetical protein